MMCLRAGQPAGAGFSRNYRKRKDGNDGKKTGSTWDVRSLHILAYPANDVLETPLAKGYLWSEKFSLTFGKKITRHKMTKVKPLRAEISGHGEVITAEIKVMVFTDWMSP